MAAPRLTDLGVVVAAVLEETSTRPTSVNTFLGRGRAVVGKGEFESIFMELGWRFGGKSG